MVNKNTTKKKQGKQEKKFPLIKLICIIFFLVGVIIFVISVVTSYKTYTGSEIIKANVINVSGTIKYRYSYDNKKYEENVRQSVDEIKVGDKKEIRIRKSIPEKIIITTMTTAICTIIAFTLCFIASLGVLVAVAWLADLDEEIRERRF